uniref:Uncharacterized protein n=1 Tax=Panagrolaimus sp. ES5 TaxID=591445 RepID=A0AC34FJH5_9BILA
MPQLKPLFGEDFVNACGFNEETVQLYKGNVPIAYPSRIPERKLITSAAIMEDSTDTKGLCKALKITEMEMLTLQLNGLKNFEALVKFIKENVKSKTLVCSISIVTHEIEIKGCEPAENHIKQISKILLGHHICMCIPVERTVRTLTLQLNGLKNFEALFKFIKENVKSKTLVCSISIVTHEIEIKGSEPVENHIKQISKILLGHHICMCIPVERTVRTDTVENVLMNGVELSPEVLQCFQREAVAIFDYEAIHTKPGVDIIKDSQTYVFGATKSLLVELAEETVCAETSAVELSLYLILIAGGIAIFSMAFGRGRK